MTPSKLRIGYFADGPWSHRALELLLKDPSMELVFICVRFAKGDVFLEDRARQLNIPTLRPKNVNSPESISLFAKLKADIFVSMSFDQIFRKEFIEVPPLRTINCHAGKLPFYRGRNVLNWVLINDDHEFGITVHYVDEGIDTGDIILQRVFPITDADTYKTLLDRAFTACAQLLYDSLKLVQSGECKPLPQSQIHPVGFYCGWRREGDERLSWGQTGREVFNFVRAICPPGPAARATLKGLPMKVLCVRQIPHAPSYRGTAGEIVGKTESGFVVKTLDTTVEVTEYEYDCKVSIGDRFS